MTDKIKFTFLARRDDLIALTNLAGACDRSRAAMLRKLIRDANRLQKNSSVAPSLPANATEEFNHRSHLETNDIGKHTTPATG